jgi:hypothetical protein
MEDIHIHHMASAGKICCSIVFVVNMFPNSSEYESTRIDGLGIASRHLQDNCKYRRHRSNQPPTSFNSSTSFIAFWYIIWNIEHYHTHQLRPSIKEVVLKHTVDLADVNKLEQVLGGGEDKMRWSEEERGTILCQEPLIGKQCSRPRQREQYVLSLISKAWKVCSNCDTLPPHSQAVLPAPNLYPVLDSRSK